MPSQCPNHSNHLEMESYSLPMKINSLDDDLPVVDISAEYDGVPDMKTIGIAPPQEENLTDRLRDGDDDDDDDDTTVPDNLSSSLIEIDEG